MRAVGLQLAMDLLYEKVAIVFKTKTKESQNNKKKLHKKFVV